MLRRTMVIDKPADTGEERTQSLIARIRNGESFLFAELVKPYERRVYVTALALLRNEADAFCTAAASASPMPCEAMPAAVRYC